MRHRASQNGNVSVRLGRCRPPHTTTLYHTILGIPASSLHTVHAVTVYRTVVLNGSWALTS